MFKWRHPRHRYGANALIGPLFLFLNECPAACHSEDITGKNGANFPKPKDTSGRGAIMVMITFSLEIKSCVVPNVWTLYTPARELHSLTTI
jgi:hypothetical protein